MRKTILMITKILFGSLLNIYVFAGEHENTCNVSVEYIPRFIGGMKREKTFKYVRDLKELEELVNQDLKQKYYKPNPDSPLKFYLKFNVDIENSETQSYVLRGQLFARHKEIERLMLDPTTSPYLDLSKIYSAINTHENLSKSLWWSRGESLAELGKQLLKFLPVCSEMKPESSLFLNKLLNEILEDLKKNMDLKNENFQARLPEKDSLARTQYCVSEYSRITCKNEEAGPRTLRLGTCTADVHFQINGDPRRFQQALYGYGNAKDDLNAPLVSLIWNIPLLGTPELIGKWITNTIAENRAQQELMEFIKVYPRCQK